MSKSIGNVEKQPLVDDTALCGLTKLLIISIARMPFSSCHINERVSEPEIPRFQFFYINDPSNQCPIPRPKMLDRETCNNATGFMLFLLDTGGRVK